jgi:hypothetical protein
VNVGKAKSAGKSAPMFVSKDRAVVYDAVMESIGTRLHAQLDQMDAARVTELSADEIADRMIAVLPDPNVAFIDKAIGPFYDTIGVARWLGRSRQLVHRSIGTKYFALRTADNVVLFPSFQFLPGGDPIPGLFDVIHVLESAIKSEWSIAYWLNAPREEFGGRSAAALLKDGALDEVLAFARRSTAELSR